MLSWAEPSNPAHKHISNIEHAHNYWHHVHVHRTGWPNIGAQLYVCMYVYTWENGQKTMPNANWGSLANCVLQPLPPPAPLAFDAHVHVIAI